MLFLENEVQIDRNNYGTMLFMSKQGSLPKISLILQKMIIGQNLICALVDRSPLIIQLKLINETKIRVYFITLALKRTATP